MTILTLGQPGDPPTLAVRGRRARLRRSVVVTSIVGLLATVLFVVTMMVGESRLGPWEVVASVLGLSDNPGTDFIVRTLRLPTATTSLFVGVALGVAGLSFQRLLNNPLASPDFVGISSGASLFAVTAIILLGFSSFQISVAALAGAIMTAAGIYLLAWRGGITGYRFILIGIGISELLRALVGWVIARAELYDAREAMVWLTGSSGRAGTTELRVLIVAVLVLVPIALVLSRPLGVLELGDDAARGLGVGVEAARLTVLAIAVVLVAMATAAAGPMAFVALIAGPIAVRLLRGSGLGLLTAGLVGACIVLVADLVARHGLPASLPTGVVTGAIGAPYLIWLLVHVNREGRGG
ncbi:FecCD family ABC transporter permease [Aeromicrobium sp. CTD01-1L150]|uniref:FecCD family ABC transporter permease n=1 Tax=Aeromicrobium sp. CTD01-1L150 TaxID=3341830 RepID=UPI0035C1CCD8